ncbi:MAG: AmmeMemoRadiSam system protein B [Anaerolineales bacterium]|nr:AmmeMemoRadiSam system protein B [Anaerolineales bacterium]
MRAAACAGIFYSADVNELRRDVQAYLEVSEPDAGWPVPKAIIAPHAGYEYSGVVSATAYASLRKASDIIRRVILIGPAHRVPVYGLVVPSAMQFATPLGPVNLDSAAIELALTLPQVSLSDDAHINEHSIEVHLPFLQLLLARFTLVPFAVGNSKPEQVVEILDMLWGGPETLLVISSDLSHYHDYSSAQYLDEETARSICHLRSLRPEQACGCTLINGLLRLVKQRGLQVRRLALCNSGDIAGGDKARVVGYGAFHFTLEDNGSDDYSQSEKQTMLGLAKDSIRHGLTYGEPLPVGAKDFEPALLTQRATFVTLKIDGKLRGCMGKLQATYSLAEDVASSAFAAAFRDPRFPQVTKLEAERLHIHISVLSPLEALQFGSEKDLLAQLRPGVDGLLLQEGRRRGTLLPSVWGIVSGADEFLRHLKRKAGLHERYWSADLRVSRYTAEDVEDS